MTVARAAVSSTSSPGKRLTKKDSGTSGKLSSRIGMAMEAEVSPGGKTRVPIERMKSEPPENREREREREREMNMPS